MFNEDKKKSDKEQFLLWALFLLNEPINKTMHNSSGFPGQRDVFEAVAALFCSCQITSFLDL